MTRLNTNMTPGEAYRRTRSVMWCNTAIYVNLKKDDFVKLIDSLDSSKQFHRKTNRLIDWLDMGEGAWKVDKKQDTISLYTFDGDRFYVYFTNVLDDNKNHCRIVDRRLGEIIDSGDGTVSPMPPVLGMFKKVNGVDMHKAYGTVSENFKAFVPKQFYYHRDVKDYAIINGVSGVDFSSHYPSSICGMLPDAHTMIEKDGYIEPSEEYPFAFYPNSGHMAIWNELDTHKWINTPYSDYLFRTPMNVSKEYRNYLQSPYTKDTRTILMKASPYRMDEIMRHFYDVKQSYPKDSKEYKEAKLVLNAFIGNLHRKDYTRYKYAHIAATCIARANNSMLNVLRIVPFMDVVQVCVDGLIYKGTFELGGKGGSLGSLEQEFTNRRMSFKGTNQYIVDLGNGEFKVKSGGFNTLDGKMPIEGNVHCLEDIARFTRIDVMDKLNKDGRIVWQE